MFLWVGEAIMPQITTWLIVSEQMSRLSKIWACLVCKPPSQVLLNLLISPRTESSISDEALQTSNS